MTNTLLCIDRTVILNVKGLTMTGKKPIESFNVKMNLRNKNIHQTLINKQLTLLQLLVDFIVENMQTF